MSDAPQLLIEADESAPWTDAVISLASPHRRTVVVAPDAKIETSAVEVVVGAPQIWPTSFHAAPSSAGCRAPGQALMLSPTLPVRVFKLRR